MKLNIFFRNETQSVVLKNNRKKIVIIASLFLTVLLFSLIILSSPARGKIQENPYIKSESKSGVLDEVLTIDVSAENTNDKEQYFTLIFDGEGAGLTNDYRFTEDITKIEDNSGKNITLHREISNDGAINYWFVLSRGETTDFTLKCTSGIFVTCSDDENTSNIDEASELTDEEKEKSNEERLEQKKKMNRNPQNFLL